jgi:hypothetical protein
LDSAQPPEIVFVAPEACSDRLEADRLLRQSVAPAAAPSSGWLIAARLELAGNQVRAEATVANEAGTVVAQRSLVRQSRECAPVARALGVWAALVLDAEVERVRARPVGAGEARSASATGEVKSMVVWPAAGETPAMSPPPQADDAPNPDAATFLAHPEGHRTLDFGATGLLLVASGLGPAGDTATFAGSSAFTVFEIASGWYLRPALFGAGAVNSPYAALVSTHFDACRRLPGNYPARRGMQADLCLGSDLGGVFYRDHQDRLFATIVSSAGMRGELGDTWALELRAVGGWLMPDAAVARLELGLSWGAK